MASTIDRFMDKISPEPNSGCWLWDGGQTVGGYGCFWNNGRLGLAHRFSYQEFVGQIPDGLQIDHLCRVRSCVNPKHLEPVTSRENSRRGDSFKIQDTCKKGHERTPENMLINVRGDRVCRICRREYENQRYRNRTWKPAE